VEPSARQSAGCPDFLSSMAACPLRARHKRLTTPHAHCAPCLHVAAYACAPPCVPTAHRPHAHTLNRPSRPRHERAAHTDVIVGLPAPALIISRFPTYIHSVNLSTPTPHALTMAMAATTIAETMRAVVIHGPRDVKVETVPVPKIEQEADVLIKVHLAGLCGESYLSRVIECRECALDKARGLALCPRHSMLGARCVARRWALSAELRLPRVPSASSARCPLSPPADARIRPARVPRPRARVGIHHGP